MQSIQHSAHRVYKAVADYVVPVLGTDKFADSGVLTPEQFVAAGDLLVQTCPTWSWNSGLPGSGWPFLPLDKQFLSTKGVPCLKRAGAFGGEGDRSETMVSADEGDNNGGDWVATNVLSGGPSAKDEDVPEIPDISSDLSVKCNVLSSNSNISSNNTNVNVNSNQDDDSDIPDMEDFEADDNLVDSAALPPVKVAEYGDVGDDTILRTRTYDISITYDKYYQTPRVWLFGYDERGSPLAPESIFQDISSDHAHKTVTIEKHPHLNLSHASIHPCKHANVMKAFMTNMARGNRYIRPEQYMFLFLKFISAVIPTIEYDYTIAFEGEKRL